MDILTWNVRGASNRSTRLHLKDLLRLHKPSIFALLETKCSGVVADKVCKKFRGWNFIRSDAQGRSGGIWFFWKDASLDISVIQIHHQFIHCDVKQNGRPLCFLSVVYASPCASDRDVLWTNLTSISQTMINPWFLIRDFNDIGNLDDRREGSNAYRNRAIHHRACMDACGVLDLGFSEA
ncbi:hypothetical protein M5689_003348 [Euphorbia peplus]|nr:hypothetical protein M5689_003348 [Euphorbia peplus]